MFCEWIFLMQTFACNELGKRWYSTAKLSHAIAFFATFIPIQHHITQPSTDAWPAVKWKHHHFNSLDRVCFWFLTCGVCEPIRLVHQLRSLICHGRYAQAFVYQRRRRYLACIYCKALGKRLMVQFVPVTLSTSDFVGHNELRLGQEPNARNFPPLFVIVWTYPADSSHTCFGN